MGLNPGSKGVAVAKDESFLNFHGQKNSRDSRLAAALYGTKLWGTFMTDLVHIEDSKSSTLNPTAKDVKELELHLSALGIPSSAILVGIGRTTANGLTAYAHHPVEYLPHYAGTNGHWRAENTRKIVMDISKKN